MYSGGCGIPVDPNAKWCLRSRIQADPSQTGAILLSDPCTCLVLTSPPDRAIPVGRQNLETKVVHTRRTWTRSAPLTDISWPWVRPLPSASGHPRQEQITSAEATRTRAATTGIGQKTSALPLSYRGGHITITISNEWSNETNESHSFSHGATL